MSLPEKGPIENKVWAATIGAGAGVVLSNLLLWILGCSFFGGNWRDSSGQAAINAVPDVLAAAVIGVIGVGLTFVGGYMAKHTPRNDAQSEPEELETAAEDQDWRPSGHFLPEHLQTQPVTARDGLAGGGPDGE